MLITCSFVFLSRPTIAGASVPDEFQAIIETSCVDCHAGPDSEARLDLEVLADTPVSENLADWRRVIRVLQDGSMPPEDAEPVSDRQRRRVTESVQQSLANAISAAADDPGPSALRRLTNAEYEYSIEDLTGLKLNLQSKLVSDSVGGSGFTNSATGQFMQDATLERYLEAAKIVADHAVIGAGRIYFSESPGQTGMEISAIKRIQQLYRDHGFRASAGEGAKAYGLERFKSAFHVAWQYRYRGEIGKPEATLEELAKSHSLEPKFASHIWKVLNKPSPGFPLSAITTAWADFPSPSELGDDLDLQIDRESQALYDQMQSWQRRYAGSASSEEEAALLTWNDIDVPSATEFRARGVRKRIAPDDTFTPDLNDPRLYSKDGRLHFELTVQPASHEGQQSAVVIFSNPQIRIRYTDIVEPEPQPLLPLLKPSLADALRFGQNPGGEPIQKDEFVIRVGETRKIEIELPDNSRAAEFLVSARLDSRLSQDSVVRCTITDATSERGRQYSTLLRDRNSQTMDRWEAGLEEFGTALPQISHREPAPSDRDPIPAPYENKYNLPERNYFHTAIKYHRDDQFLMQSLVDDQVAELINIAWTDLLCSFDFHDVNLRFVAKKFGIDLDGRDITSIDQAWILQQPESARRYLTSYKSEFDAMQSAMRSAERQHVRDVLSFARRAWRRPLSRVEQQSLTDFYRFGRDQQDLNHREAIRTMLVRVMVSPDFLYRIESSDIESSDIESNTNESTVKSLSGFELATRLSFSLWSSLPDDPLLNAAETGDLLRDEEIASQVSRMLRSAKSRRLATEFFGQWLGFYQFDQFRGIDRDQFPEFDDQLRSSMYNEAITYFEHLIRNDRPYREILHADYSFLNPLTAAHYGIELPNDQGQQGLVRTVTGQRRGGLFGIGAILASTSAPLRTSPVKRGDWILRRLIGTPVPPPPADVGSIPAEEVLDDGKTVRDRLESHRTRAECMNCHVRIDPLGFALENFDSLGRWRETYLDGQPIDASGVLASGAPISGIDGLKSYMQTMDVPFRRTFAAKLVAYILGRPESIADAALIEKVTSRLGEDPRISVAVTTIVQSPQFRQIRLDPSID